MSGTDAASPAPRRDTGADAPITPERLYGRWYYAHDLGVSYDDADHWSRFFGEVAEHVVNELAPKRVLDAGCARGFLVAALRERGVDACGFDISPTAIDSAPEAARGHVRVGSLLDAIEDDYDLITCVEVIEHLDPSDTLRAVANLCGATDRILLSSSPEDHAEPTHTNVQPPERWSRLFAEQGFFRDLHHDASYLTPWAALYVRGEPRLLDVVLEYDREFWALRRQVLEQRRRLLEQQVELERLAATGMPAEAVTTYEEVLRLRDLVAAQEVELGHLRGKSAELDLEVRGYSELVARYEHLRAEHDAVIASTSWRVTQALLAPLRRLRNARTSS